MPESFVDHLAGMDDEEFDTDFPMPDDKGPELASTFDQWARPEPPKLNPNLENLSFQQLELETLGFRIVLDVSTALQIFLITLPLAPFAGAAQLLIAKRSSLKTTKCSQASTDP